LGKIRKIKNRGSKQSGGKSHQPVKKTLGNLGNRAKQFNRGQKKRGGGGKKGCPKWSKKKGLKKAGTNQIKEKGPRRLGGGAHTAIVLEKKK